RLGAKVLLLEKDRFPRQKVCGEFVSPESLGLLHGLLKDDVQKNALLKDELEEEPFRSAPQIVSSRIFLDGKSLTLPVSPPAQSIPRFDLDPALFQAAQTNGVTTEEGVAVSDVQRHERFHFVAA